VEITRFHGMITASPTMLEMFDLLERVARTEASILIRGETGTGKELVARAVHALSPRAARPFRALNCATLTPNLLASELFGHVRGAFTGAVKDRPGLFALADTGSLFLDEVAEIPVDIQAQLLRVLQEKSFVPVGAAEASRVDVRLIAATHRSLRAAVEAAEFRADLMYRIRVVPLFLPALRDRPGDIEALAWHFIDQFNRDGHRRIDAVSERAMGALLEYRWPGNVRELRNVLEYAFAVGLGPVLTIDELTPELRGERPPGRPRSETLTAGGAERARIIEALDEAGGRKGAAAALLGISRSTLWRKLREHRLSGPPR